MFGGYESSSLISLNSVNVRPKRTTYGQQSTWMFMNGSHYKPSALSLDMTESRANFHSYSTSNFELPPIPSAKPPQTHTDKLPDPRELVKSPAIRDFLMKNWSKKRNEINAVSEIKSEETRKGRIGTWKSIDQAYREDGKRFLFIQGPQLFDSKDELEDYQVQARSQRLSPQGRTYFGRKLTPAYLEKLERERMGVSTRHGVEYANWNVVR